jgi:DNA-binding NarL/FixJ family response regulator
MSKEDGIDISEKLKEIDEHLKVIIMTGFPSYETAVSAMKAGVTDYIAKGSSNEKILTIVKKAVEERKKERIYIEEKQLLKEKVAFILLCDHSLIKERLENFSKSNPKFKLIRSFPSIDYIKTRSVSQQIDIALVCANCNLKSFKDAYNVFPELYRCYPGIKPVIINENFSDEEKVELVKLGIGGFFARDLSSEKLEKALPEVKKGEIWVSRTVSNLSLKYIASAKSSTLLTNKNLFGLTEREKEILRTMILGLKNKAIAEKLFISEKTVKTHINRIFKKLRVTNRTQAILCAIDKKLV